MPAERTLRLLAPVLAVGLALVAGALVIALSGRDWAYAYGALLQGALGSPRAVAETLVTTTPYILAGLAVAVGMRGGLFNIGVEGQFVLGSLAAVIVGVYGAGLPAGLHLLLALAAGVLAGAAWASIAGVMKATVGAHEVITTIMLNYIALLLQDFLVVGPLHGPTQVPQTSYIAPTAELPLLLPGTRLHSGLILALLAAFAIYLLLWRTVRGYEIRAVGLNPRAAEAAGISVARVTVLTMAISGGLGGLTGAIEVLGVQHVLPQVFASGIGFDSIAVALVGQTHPAGVVLSALLLGALRNGASTMSAVAGVSAPVISIVTALLILLMAAPAVVQRAIVLHRTRAGRPVAPSPLVEEGAGG